MSDAQAIIQPNRVCHTEDSRGWPEAVRMGFEHFGFEVDHFSYNDLAWEDPDRGIRDNPGRYDVFVIDNDTGPVPDSGFVGSIDGTVLIERILSLPKQPGRETVVIILSSSNESIFSAQETRNLREQHNVQLCWKPDTCYLQAEYARARIDTGVSFTFEMWLREAKGLDVSEKGSEVRLKGLNDTLRREIFASSRNKESEDQGRPRKEGM